MENLITWIDIKSHRGGNRKNYKFNEARLIDKKNQRRISFSQAFKDITGGHKFIQFGKLGEKIIFRFADSGIKYVEKRNPANEIKGIDLNSYEIVLLIKKSLNSNEDCINITFEDIGNGMYLINKKS